MSYRTLVDWTLVSDWAQYELSDYGSIPDLAKAMAYKLPAKIWARDKKLLGEFLSYLHEEHGMEPDFFSYVGLLDDNQKPTIVVHSPTWVSLEAVGIQRGSVPSNSLLKPPEPCLQSDHESEQKHDSD